MSSVKEPLHKPTIPDNWRQHTCFASITLIFLFTQAASFQGFNGGDDLHYTWLATKTLQGSYSPFRIDDIFSGRVLLVALQALAYAVGGVNTFTSQLVSHLCVVLAVYFTIFRLLKPVTVQSVVVATSLFYFNPVLAGITLGPAPDPMIMLWGVFLLMLQNRLGSSASKNNFVAIGLASGALIFSTLLIKESGLVFLPFAVITVGQHRWKYRWHYLVAVLFSFGICVAATGLVYKIYTGNFFFRIAQIQHSFYPNPCYYTSFFSREMAIRLTYGVWSNFLANGFYTVLLASVAVLLALLTGQFRQLRYAGSFLILLLLALYFPFSFSNYQPLCFKARHFLFLMPLAVVVSTQFMDKAHHRTGWSTGRRLVAALLLAACVKYYWDGRYWDVYRCLLLWFVFLPFLINRTLAAASYLVFSLSLWLLLPYQVLFYPTDWWKNMNELNTQLSGGNFYFPDHDNYMHWNFLKKFDTAVHIYSFDEKPFNNVPYPYYRPLASGNGWLIVNHQYTSRSPAYLHQIDSLAAGHYFSDYHAVGQVSAYYLNRFEQYRLLQQLIATEKKRTCNCDLTVP